MELVLDPQNPQRMVEMKRVHDENDCEMCAWRMILFTPEFPLSRDLVVIATTLLTHKDYLWSVPDDW